MPKPYLPMETPHGDGTVTRGFDACNIAAVLKNPLYVRADKNVYEYLLKNNYRIIDDVDAFDGKHGLFWHNYRSKTDRYVKVGYHEGLVDADVWLTVQEKFSHHQIPIRKGFASLEYISDNKILFCYPECYCACVKRVSGELSRAWCYCTLGNAEGIFREVFKKEIKVTLFESIKTGGEKCVIEVEW